MIAEMINVQTIHQGRMDCSQRWQRRVNGVGVGVGPIRINDGFECREEVVDAAGVILGIAIKVCAAMPCSFLPRQLNASKSDFSKGSMVTSFHTRQESANHLIAILAVNVCLTPEGFVGHHPTLY